MDNDDRDPVRGRELGMDRPITRRDFLNGVAIGVGGAVASSWVPGAGVEAAALGQGAAGGAQGPAGGAQDAAGYHPAARLGLRGSHAGTFEVGHAVRDGGYLRGAGSVVQTGETYDLVVVGGGFSGLAAVYFYRARAGASARILILDNHDDFGGHAKRNEFVVDGRLLVTNGGTQLISSPFPYSPEARRLMDDLGIDPQALSAKCVDRNVYQGLQSAYFFDKETFGADRLVIGSPGSRGGLTTGGTVMSWKEFLAKTPLSAEVQRDIARLEEENVDYMPGLSSDEKKDRLSRMSYKDFLLSVVKVHPDVIPFYQSRPHGLMAIGIDGIAALDGWAWRYPGFQGLKLEPGTTPRNCFSARGDSTPQEPYSFHHPDGMASVARQLVRSLVPSALTGGLAEDIVTAKVDYSRLDRSESPVRLRLNSTAVRVRHLGDPASASEVEVLYSRGGRVSAVRGKGVVLACWNSIIPLLCPELPDPQKEALKFGVKAPLVYTAVAIRNWTAFRKLGIRSVSAPGMYHGGASLDQSINIGDYQCSKSPQEPVVLRMTRVPLAPGLPQREQFRAGHAELLATTFATFELKIRDQLGRMLASGGFDPARDIAGIIVNRWPHGYAYEYSSLWDPDLPEEQLPHVVGRKPFGRIAIANSDASGSAYADLAMNQGYRAVQELLKAV